MSAVLVFYECTWEGCSHAGAHRLLSGCKHAEDTGCSATYTWTAALVPDACVRHEWRCDICNERILFAVEVPA